MDAVKRDAIPAFDLTSFADDQARLGTALGRAARDTGFFCVTHHGIDAALIAQVFSLSARFFSQHSADKSALSIKHAGNNRGYVALGEERLDAAKPGDVKEAFNIGWDLPSNHPEVVAGKPFRGVNVWPAAELFPDFRATMLTYFDACHQPGMQLHRALAHDLGVAEDFFDDKLDQPLATLRLQLYPPRPDRF